MCGRYSQTKPLGQLRKQFPFAQSEPQWLPRFNIAPSQEGMVIVNDGIGTLKLMRWGLVPFWAKEESIGHKMINARAETLAEKPAYRDAFKKKRCLILADGFYEWKKAGGARLPHRFVMSNREPFAFAGLWDSWKRQDDAELKTFTIITTTSNDICRTVHDRMPAILDGAHYEQWLDPRVSEVTELAPLLRPYVSESMQCYQVSTLVNNPCNDDPKCAEPLSMTLDLVNQTTLLL